MTNLSAEVTIEILTPWHVGSGREGGAYADSLVNKDHQGLPLLNGKSLKGLLRAACTESLAYEWLEGLSEDDVKLLFGTEGPNLSNQGALELSSATLSEAEQAYFQQHPDAIKYLYRIDYQTAINPDTGTAKEGSLRSIETVIPMTLTARLTIRGCETAQAQRFLQWLTISTPLITAVGAKRRRGYGEAIVRIIEENS